jgi:hypothetical protein
MRMRNGTAGFFVSATPIAIAALATVAVAAAAIACSSSDAPSGFLDNDAGTSFVTGDGGVGNFGSDGSAAGDGGSNGECPASATLVYVTGIGDKLYSWDPQLQKFTLIGTFDCLNNPTHMTIDRLGNAWVVSAGQLYKASTVDAKCSAVSNWSFDIDYLDFSLSFVGNQNSDKTLYLLNGDGKLSSFDTAAGALTGIGDVGIANAVGDMTSNGDGSLYFLHDVVDLKLYKFNPTTGATLSTAKINAVGGGNQALAFWGGRFYAFENGEIFEYDPGAKTTKAVGMAPLQVTGAGQSTCVPKVPPPPR